jgi:hypothetical protein
MNKTQLFACVAGVLVGASAFAQGTFAFSTTAKALQGAKILDPNGVAITGANYLIDVLVKQSDGTFSQAGLLKVTTGGNVALAPVNALAGAGAGLFSGGAILVGNIAPGAPATVKVIAWDVSKGATYDASTIRGSQTFDIAALGGTGVPASLPVAMSNFTGFSLQTIPEPSTYALAALGLGGLLLFRRK